MIGGLETHYLHDQRRIASRIYGFVRKLAGMIWRAGSSSVDSQREVVKIGQCEPAEDIGFTSPEHREEEGR